MTFWYVLWIQISLIPTLCMLNKNACHSETLVCPSQGVLPLNGTMKIGILKVPVRILTCQIGIACDIVSLPVPN